MANNDDEMGAVEARELLVLERQRTAALEMEAKMLRAALVALGESTEFEEERMTNRLIKRLSDVKGEKEKLALEVEREEELLTNNLQKKLDQLRKEKVDLENKLENEQEYIVNRLSKQLEAARAEKERLLQELQSEDASVRHALESQVAKILHEKVHLENELEQEQEFLVNRLQKQLTGMQAEKRRMERKLARENVALFDQMQLKLDVLRLECGDDANVFADGVTKLVAKAKEQQAKKAADGLKTTKDDISVLDWAASSSSSCKTQLTPEGLVYQHIRRGTM
ncbi:hypothetical protein BBJ28_00020337 [Nothophytophthora sp. Chile5]|nr:hypothetical protein BBJ28_00020337 [Nothophytophthora sp. Chile5]